MFSILNYAVVNAFSLHSSQIFCEGEILDVVQRSQLYADCKTFVDMHVTADPGKVQLYNVKEK